MKRSRVSDVILWWLFLLLCASSHAQDRFAYRAKINVVTQSGFYNIALPPRLTAKCRNELEDVRILDGKSSEVPYILYTETARPNEESFTEFPISYSKNRAEIIISNILPNSIGKLFLLIKNSEAQRSATLSGSDDAKHWFIIKENIILQREYAAGSDAFVQSVSFPQSSYKYFRIAMPGKNVLPLNIVKAGVYRQTLSGNVYDSLPRPAIVQTDSADRRSYYYLSFDDAYEIDMLNLTFSGVKFYKRSVTLYDKNTINSSLSYDTVSSAKPAGIELHAKTNRLLLVIDNKNNAPLTLQSVAAFGLHTSVTAYLEKGKSYALYFGDSTAIAPAYDLQYFNDSIGSNIRPLGIKNVELIKTQSDAKKEKSDRSNWLLWGIIVAVLGLLVYFSFRMMKDMDKKGNDAHL